MENTESRLQQTIQAIKDWTNRQSDPTSNPYVKDKSFYESIINTPIENSKMAAYRDTLANLELLKIANSRLPGNRENLMAIAQGLMKQSSDVAEQGANISNEMARRKTISETLQGMQDMKNPLEVANTLKILESIGGSKYNPAEVAANYGTKESANQYQFQGMSALANIYGGLYSQEQQRAIQREQMAQSARLANMRMAGGGSGGGLNINFKDIYNAQNKYNKILSEIEEASRHPFYQKNPGHFKDLVGRYLNEVNALAAQDPLNGKRMVDDFGERVAELIPEREPRVSSESNIFAEDILNGASTGDSELDELIRQVYGSKHINNDISNNTNKHEELGFNGLLNELKWVMSYPGSSNPNNLKEWYNNRPSRQELIRRGLASE